MTMLSVVLVLLGPLIACIHAFSFTTSTPTECTPLTVNWQGGQPPFQLLLLPIYAPATNISIPPSAFSTKTQNGSYSFPITIPRSKQFVLTMSDATGYASGGSSTVLTVAPGPAAACNTTVSSPSFFFQLNSALQQCRPFIVSGYANAILPISFIVTVPGGTSLPVYSPTNGTSFPWVANVKAGTSLLFSVFDATGDTGGSSDVRVVSISDNSTCLGDRDPISITPLPSPTSGSGSSPQTSPSPSGQPISSAVVAAIVVSTLSSLAVLAAILFFWFRKKKKEENNRDQKSPLIIDPFPPTSPPASAYWSNTEGRISTATSGPTGIQPMSIADSPFISAHLPAEKSSTGLPTYQQSMNSLNGSSPRHFPSQNTLSSASQSRPLSSNLDAVASGAAWGPHFINQNDNLPPGAERPMTIHTFYE